MQRAGSGLGWTGLRFSMESRRMRGAKRRQQRDHCRLGGLQEAKVWVRGCECGRRWCEGGAASACLSPLIDSFPSFVHSPAPHVPTPSGSFHCKQPVVVRVAWWHHPSRSIADWPVVDRPARRLALRKVWLSMITITVRQMGRGEARSSRAFHFADGPAACSTSTWFNLFRLRIHHGNFSVSAPKRPSSRRPRRYTRYRLVQSLPASS